MPNCIFQGFVIEAIWGLTLDEAEVEATEMNIPYATNKIDEVLLRKDVDLIIIMCPPSHHLQIAVKALGQFQVSNGTSQRAYRILTLQASANM